MLTLISLLFPSVIKLYNIYLIELVRVSSYLYYFQGPSTTTGITTNCVLSLKIQLKMGMKKLFHALRH